jgi:uncharacterized protein (DUF433 family)
MMELRIDTQPLPIELNDEGVAQVGGTRVTLDTLVAAFREGATAEEIVQQYPSLKLADVYSVIGYYLRSRAEVDAYLSERQEQRERVKARNEEQLDPQGIRARLVARWKP